MSTPSYAWACAACTLYPWPTLHCGHLMPSVVSQRPASAPLSPPRWCGATLSPHAWVAWTVGALARGGRLVRARQRATDIEARSEGRHGPKEWLSKIQGVSTHGQPLEEKQRHRRGNSTADTANLGYAGAERAQRRRLSVVYMCGGKGGKSWERPPLLGTRVCAQGARPAGAGSAGSVGLGPARLASPRWPGAGSEALVAMANPANTWFTSMHH
jgi:hypothetical protein